MKKINIFLWYLAIFFFTIKLESNIANQYPDKVLEIFFQTLIKESETGYVLNDIKPMSVHGFLTKDTFCVNSPIHKQTVALREGARVWKGLKIDQSNYIIHVSNEEDPLIPGYYHILSINKALFEKAVEDNLILFKYILGSSVTAKSLLNSLLSQKSTYYTLLNGNKVLTGILLGFGTENSIYVARIENILEHTEKDIPPFKQGAKDLDLCDVPGFGYKSFEEEINEMQKNTVVSSKKLVYESPNFIFGWIKELKDNKKLISELERVQKEVQSELTHKNILELTYKKLSLTYVSPFYTKEYIDINIENYDINYIISKGLWEYIKEYDSECIPFFIKSLDMNESELEIHQSALSPYYIVDLKTAFKNLSDYKSKFDKLKKDSTYNEINPYNIFYREICPGSGKDYLINSEVILDYSIFSPEEICIENRISKKIDLNETIPGFSLGIETMGLNEVREIFIPPSLSYGFDTSLEKCIYLRAIVKVKKIIKRIEKCSKQVKFINLEQYEDINYYKSCYDKHITALKCLASKIGQHLKKCPGVNLSDIQKTINNFYIENERVLLTENERNILNKIHWKIYFENHE